MAEIKYQVFISSTYQDLIEERKKIYECLLAINCIPAGMEAFSAADDEQFNVIKRVIDLCDYYILIIKRRYGTINSQTNKSYTEMEFEYAIQKGIPVLVFSLDESIDVPANECESDPTKIKLLESFRSKALNNRTAKIWRTTDELISNVVIATSNAIMYNKRPGWQRGSDYDEASLRREIMEISKSNSELKVQIETAYEKLSVFENELPFDEVNITICYVETDIFSQEDVVKKETVSLKNIFFDISLNMLNQNLDEEKFEGIILESVHAMPSMSYIFEKSLVKRIILHIKAIGLIEYREFGRWGLTEKGIFIRDNLAMFK